MNNQNKNNKLRIPNKLIDAAFYIAAIFQVVGFIVTIKARPNFQNYYYYHGNLYPPYVEIISNIANISLLIIFVSMLIYAWDKRAKMFVVSLIVLIISLILAFLAAYSNCC